MNALKIIWRVLPHLLGWSALILIILIQNDLSEWDYEDYYSVSVFFGFMGIATYINLYLLIPHYLFKRLYWHYSIIVFAIIIVASSSITILTNDYDSTSWFSRFIVNTINTSVFLLITSGGKFLIGYLNKILKIKEMENKQLKDELSLLKAQVHPHFLFNTLNNLYGLITQDQNQKACEITLKLADLMRYLLESNKRDIVSLSKEVNFLENYLSLEKIRLSKNADIKFEAIGVNPDIFVAPMLFIPLVENAFKHGLVMFTDYSFAHFSLAVQGNDLFFEAKNSVSPITVINKLENHQKIKSGSGLKNLKKRLQLVYPNKHQLEIESTERFFKVTLHLQL